MAHCNTILGQILKMVSRHEFEVLAKAHHSGRSFRSASRWSQFSCLVMAQLTGRCSLRDIIDSASSQLHRLYHLGCSKLSRSNLARLKKNAGYRVLKRQKVNKKQGLTCDQTIEFTGSITAKKCPIRLRRVGYRDLETGKHYIFLTNNFKLCARTIADLYKSRWQVELFFKWIKQNLKIKSFIGTSKNAVLTQVWIALCVYLILAFIKFQSKLSKSMQQILRLLQVNLFEKRDLMALLRGDPPLMHKHNIQQMALL